LSIDDDRAGRADPAIKQDIAMRRNRLIAARDQLRKLLPPCNQRL